MELSRIRITILVDNGPGKEGLIAEHGLSIWIETPEARILFDTGQGPAFAKNAVRLGISLEKTDTLILSHGHYDHTGGLPTLAERSRDFRLVLHPEATRSRFAKAIVPRSIGMPELSRTILKDREQNVIWNSGPVQIESGIWATGAIPRRTVFEDTGGDFYLDRGCSKPDLIPDDQALWIQDGEKLVVVLGCAHSGIINTLDYITSLTGITSIFGVIGGTHLLRASTERLEETCKELEQRHVQFLAPCHCTGEVAAAFFADRFPAKFLTCSTGSHFTF